MTERVLPGIAIPAPGRRSAGDGARSRPAAAARPAVVAHRREPFLTMPARAGMLIGASAAVYATTLAGVSVLQSSSDAAIAARRAPYVDAVAGTRAANDALEAALLRADAAVRRVADEYAATGAGVAAYEARLDELAALVAEVEGSAAALPTRITLPRVSSRGAISVGRGGGRAPATNTTTRASGG